MATPIPIEMSVFRPDAVSPATRAFNERLEEVLAASPALNTQTPAEIRAARASGRGTYGPVVHVDWARDGAIPGPGGQLPIRTFVPNGVRGVYLHFHGGGFCIGSNDQQDTLLARIAAECQLAVVSVGYRLAPEDPFPAGPDDCEAAALWLARNALGEFGSDRLLIGGESAGATLAVVTLLRLRDRHGFSRFRAAKLTYGLYDFTLTPSAAGWGDRYLILNTPIMGWVTGHYLSPGIDLRDPDISPIYADLSGLPPALFAVGTLDPLLDDSLFMYARWLAAGNEAELAVYPGGTHAFDLFPTDLAHEANARGDAFLVRAVADGT